MSHLRFLWPYFRRNRGRLIGGLLSNAASAATGLAAPLILGRAIDALSVEVTQSRLLTYAGLLVGIALLQGVFTFLQRIILVTMSRNIELDLRALFFDHVERQPPEFFDRHPTGDLMARATNDLAAVRMLCGPAIMYGTNTIFTGFGALAFMLTIDPLLTLVALSPMPLVALVTKFFGQRIHQLFTVVQERFSDLSSAVQEHLAGVRVVRAYAREKREVAEFERRNHSYVEGNRRLIRWQAALHPLIQSFVGLGMVAVLGYGGLLVSRGGISVGEFVTFYFFLNKLVWPMVAVGWVINLLQRGSASLTRIRQVLAIEPAIRDDPQAVDPGELRGDVGLAGLTFAYGDGAPVLRGIDLEVPAGSTVALVGRTGSGKSTLLSLIPRLAEPPPGSLAVDGYDVRLLRLDRLRGSIGMVPQETFLFSATVAGNIAFGRPGASREEIEEAARMAGLGQDLERFPRGLDTVVGERGITLSGGQKQRVALARALLRRPRILLLDDCLSAVDTHTEEEILGNLRRVFAGRTVFLVSHRVSTVQSADQIVVLEEGKIAERGTHDELLALGGLYADLHQRQQLEEELAAV